jgi:hypothetical protein
MAKKLVDRAEALSKTLRIKPETYEYDVSFQPATSIDDVHTIPELMAFAESDKSIELEGVILCQTANGLKHKKLNKTQMIEAYKSERAGSVKLREADVFGLDEFAFDGNGDAVRLGYATNLSVISTLVGRHDYVLSDKLNHASIVDGCLLSGAKFVRFPAQRDRGSGGAAAIDSRLGRQTGRGRPPGLPPGFAALARTG